MAYSIFSQSGKIAYDINHYIVDSEADLEMLPINDTAGSTCEVIETGDIYILSNGGEWKKKIIASGGGSGSGENCGTKDGAISELDFNTETKELVLTMQDGSEKTIILPIRDEYDDAELRNLITQIQESIEKLEPEVEDDVLVL